MATEKEMTLLSSHLFLFFPARLGCKHGITYVCHFFIFFFYYFLLHTILSYSLRDFILFSFFDTYTLSVSLFLNHLYFSNYLSTSQLLTRIICLNYIYLVFLFFFIPSQCAHTLPHTHTHNWGCCKVLGLTYFLKWSNIFKNFLFF